MALVKLIHPNISGKSRIFYLVQLNIKSSNLGFYCCDPINLGEDVARAIESWVGLLGYLMGLIVVTLESRLCKFNAPSNIA